jgi:hypothetical protein
VDNTKLIAHGSLEFAKNYAVEKVGNSIEVVYELLKLCGNVDAQCDHVHMETCAIVPGEWACQLLSVANVPHITQQ